jgi:hypothetical protein
MATAKNNRISRIHFIGKRAKRSPTMGDAAKFVQRVAFGRRDALGFQARGTSSAGASRQR